MRRRRAFTLLEVLVALGVVAMLAGTVFAFILALLRGRDRLLDASRDAQAAAAVIERVESDMLVTFVGSATSPGVSGDRASIRLRGRAVSLDAPEASAGMSDVQACELRYDERHWRLEGRRWAGAEAGEFETICDRVEAFRLRYFDGRRWVSSFDTPSAGTLPVAIEIAAWFGRPPPEGGELSDDGADSLEAMGLGAPDDLASFADDPGAEPRPLPTREPDLLRVVIVPDGPVAAWRGSP